MTTLADSFDPWGPISVALYDVGNADYVETTVSATGLIGSWRPLGRADLYSNVTRIRARKPEISAAYYGLPTEYRGVFIQRLLKDLHPASPKGSVRSTRRRGDPPTT
jgi:hypothetical protein